MAVALRSAQLTLDIDSRITNALDLSTPQDAFAFLESIVFTNGNGDDQANVHWHDQRSLAATTAEELDLQALANGAYGTVVLTDIRALLIVNTGTAGSLEVGGAASNAWEQFVKAAGDIVVIKAGTALNPAFLLWVAPNDGDGVVDATHKQLQVNNVAGSTQVYKIYILGVA